MANYNMISINRLFAKVIRDFNLSNTNWRNSAIEWVAEAIREIGTVLPFNDCSISKLIIDYKIHLPCNYHLVIGVKDKNNCAILPFTGSNFSLSQKHKNNENTNYYTVNGNFLNFPITDEEITILYKDFYLDSDGFPMILDSPKYKEALIWYIMYKYLLGGNTHININWKMAYDMWTKLKHEARNDLFMPGPDEMEVVLSNWLGSFPNYDLNH